MNKQKNETPEEYLERVTHDDGLVPYTCACNAVAMTRKQEKKRVTKGIIDSSIALLCIAIGWSIITSSIVNDPNFLFLVLIGLIFIVTGLDTFIVNNFKLTHR